MAKAYKRTKTATSARKQAETFSTPKGGAVGIRKSNVASATKSGATQTARTAWRPLAERDRASNNVSNTVSKGATQATRKVLRPLAEKDRQTNYTKKKAVRRTNG